ncbi:kinase-like domain-containing protein [Nemania abortiva]|nr:kinase-like domain-containing protein [Nemania abortiva]
MQIFGTGGNDNEDASMVDAFGNDPVADEAERQQRVHQIRTHFNNQSAFTYERMIGNGVYGMTFNVLENRVFFPPRRLVVKRALNERDEYALDSEIRIMKLLNGAAHIASVIATSEDPGQQERRGPCGRLVSGFRVGERNFLVGLPGPTLVLEFLENGQLNAIRDKLIARNNEAARLGQEGPWLPNRLLWKWFLCFARACVAMKFPPNRPVDTRPELEEIPADQSNPTDIIHRDMHGGNILIGVTGDFPEHNVVPPLKLIDFGVAQLSDEGDAQNIYDVGTRMFDLVRGSSFSTGGFVDEWAGVRTVASYILPKDGVDPYPNLDPDLRHLIALCLAVDPSERPSAAELLHYCKLAVDQKPPEWYGPNQALETDEGISLTLQALVYDAD